MSLQKEILKNPNESKGWLDLIRYVGLNQGVLKAMAKTDKALNSINYSHEGEKFKIWQAKLNLSYFFCEGEQFQEVFHQAMSANKTEDIIAHVLELHKK